MFWLDLVSHKSLLFLLLRTTHAPTHTHTEADRRATGALVQTSRSTGSRDAGRLGPTLYFRFSVPPPYRVVSCRLLVMLLTLECVCWTAPGETLHSNGCRCRRLWLLKQIFVLRGKKVRGLHANHRWKCLLCIFPPEQLNMKRRPIWSGLFGVFLKRNQRDRRGDAGETHSQQSA